MTNPTRTAEEIAREIADLAVEIADAERHTQGMFDYVLEFAEPLIAAAITEARREEREKIAEWLRGQADYKASNVATRARTVALIRVAMSIERSEHIRARDPKEGG